MSDIKILAVKLRNDGESMIIGFKESDKIKSDDEKTCHDAVHPDLVDAVQALRVHLALRTGLIKQSQTSDTSELEKFKVTGYSLGTKEDRITIKGMRKNEEGQWYPLNAPHTRIEGTEEKKYILLGDLLERIKKIEAEVREYLFEGKKKQPDLFNGKEAKVTKAKIANEQTQEEKDEETLKKMRSSKLNQAVSENADPEAMKRVADMDKEDKAGEVGDMIQGERDKLKGRGKKSTAA